MKRSRGRGRRPHSNNSGSNNSSGSHNNSNNNNNPNRTFDSSGPEIKIRGSAPHVYEKYLQLARDSNASGDRVMAENYLQHAEHYYRIMAAQQAQMQQYQAQQQQQHQNYNNANGNQAGQGNNQPSPQPQPVSGPSFSLNEQGGDEEEGEETETAQ